MKSLFYFKKYYTEREHWWYLRLGTKYGRRITIVGLGPTPKPVSEDERRREALTERFGTIPPMRGRR